MPPDTLLEKSVTLSDGSLFKYSLRKNDTSNPNIDSLIAVIVKSNASSNIPNDKPSFGFMGLIFVVAFFVLLYHLIFRFFPGLKVLFLVKINNADLPIVKSTLEKYFPYYQNYNDLDKEKFAKRVLAFAANRNFEFETAYKDEEKIIYLISATAVQLTFGLDYFLLNHFKKVYVFDEAYPHISSEILFQGHIQHGEMHFSWKDLFAGLSNPHDKNNVGLHEAAHALTYECFNLGGQGDYHFKNEFSNFSKIARPIFSKIQVEPNDYLGSYAATNYNEFWAVSVEAFFEQPERMNDEFPDLYKAMAKLLRQDVLFTKN